MIISNLPNYKKIVLVIILLAIIFHELIWHYLNKYLNLNLNNKKDEKKDEKKVKSKENFTNMNTYSHTFSLSNIFKNSTSNNEKYISILNTNQYNFLPDFFQKNLSKSNFLKSNVVTNMTPDEYFKIENRNLKANNSEYKKK
tara:strand:+ start:10 stop:435 length:426 start_codon:yes stop_codon:yes gene_type:complete